MRICIPIHSFKPGGVERVGLRLAEHWRDAGHEVIVVLGRDRGATRGHAPAVDYRTRPEPIPTEQWETFWLIWCLWRFLRGTEPAARPDVLFCPGNTYTIVCVVMKLLLGRRCPPVLVKISNDLARADLPRPVRAGYRAWLRLQGRLLDRFVATAPPMARQAPDALGLPAAQIVTIPNPILRLERLVSPARTRPPHPGRCFLAVGRLEPQKNYRMMIAAFARIAGPADRLTIAGEGSERTAIETAIDRAGLSGQVVLKGHVADTAPLYPEADALVMSSEYEGLPGTVVEALAAGLPVAATDCCASMAWLLGDGAFGKLSPTGDVESLAAAMNGAAAMKPEIAKMREFASLFTVEQAAPLYLDQFEALASKPLSHRLRLADADAADQTDRIPC